MNKNILAIVLIVLASAFNLEARTLNCSVLDTTESDYPSTLLTFDLNLDIKPSSGETLKETSKFVSANLLVKNVPGRLGIVARAIWYKSQSNGIFYLNNINDKFPAVTIMVSFTPKNASAHGGIIYPYAIDIVSFASPSLFFYARSIDELYQINQSSKLDSNLKLACTAP